MPRLVPTIAVNGAHADDMRQEVPTSKATQTGGPTPRHSFATSLMNGGMSLVGIMKLLGHRDQRMTMRYAQIADETVGREYFEALSRVSERYASIGAAATLVHDPLELLQNVIRWLAKELCVGRTERQARLLIRRLEAARDDLEALRSEAGEAR